MNKAEKREYDRLRREKKGEILRLEKKLYYFNNIEKFKEYRKRNSEKRKAARKAYYLANRERELSMNREYLKTYVRNKTTIAQTTAKQESKRKAKTIAKALRDAKREAQTTAKQESKRKAKISNAERKARWDEKNRETARLRGRIFYRKNREKFQEKNRQVRDRQRQIKQDAQMIALQRMIQEETSKGNEVKNG